EDGIERGRHAGIDSGYRPLTSEERQILRAGIDESYKDFVTKVADARHRKFQQIEPVSQGRVWMGDQAKAQGLVDELGGLDTALDLAKKKAKIAAAENVTVVIYPSRRDFLDLLLRKSASDMLESRLAQVFGAMPFHAWMQGGYLRLMPYWV